MKTTLALLLIAIAGAIFFSTHHPVYSNCHNTVEGRVCTLTKWVHN